MKALLAIMAGLLSFICYLPYMHDIYRGRVRPARATRLMFVLILAVTVLQQQAIGSGWLLAITVGEAVGSLLILGMSLRRGTGGLRTSDLICYVLLGADIVIWVASRSAIVALHLSVLADLIAFTPVLIKTWRQPSSETPLFYILGALAVALNIIAADRYTYQLLLVPAYLLLVNVLEVVLIVGRTESSRGAA